jgi:hypothetical protein
MKVTVDIPDDLYREVKAKSALEGRPVREVTVELFEGYVGRATKTPAPAKRGNRRPLADGRPAPAWFALARRHIRSVKTHDMDAVRESIGRGWAQEVSESEAALRKTKNR